MEEIILEMVVELRHSACYTMVARQRFITAVPCSNSKISYSKAIKTVDMVKLNSTT